MVPRHIRGQRRQRAEVKDRLKDGSTSLSQVLQEAQGDDVMSGMRVSALLESLPGIGKARARQIMNRLGIAESGLVRELNAAQRAALESEHGRPTGAVVEDDDIQTIWRGVKPSVSATPDEAAGRAAPAPHAPPAELAPPGRPHGLRPHPPRRRPTDG